MSSEHEYFMVSLKVLMKNSRGEFLLLKSPETSRYWQGKYDLPGGRINQDEIDVDFHALIDREIKEEVGPNIKYKLRKDPVALEKWRTEKGNSFLYVLFEAEYMAGEIEISPEHNGYLWQKITRRNLETFFHPKFVELMKNYFDWNNVRQ